MIKYPTFLLLLAISPSVVFAEEATELEEITVTTATKTQKNIDGVTASVDVITAAEIEKTGATTLKDVIKNIPSFTTQYAGFPHPSSKSKAAISIRGAGANGTLILVDGKRLSGETENPYEMDRIPTSIIERIEVVKGSMSTLYGSDAIGGVINIITKKPTDKPITTINVKYGQNEDGDGKNKSVNASTMGKKGKVSYKVYASTLQTTPFTINKNYTQQAVHPNTHAPVPNPINGTAGTLAVTYRDEADVNTIGFGVGYDVSANTKLNFDLNYFTEDREGQYVGIHPKPVIVGGAVVGKVMVQNTPVNSVDDNNRIDVSVDVEHITKNEAIIKARAYHSKYKKRNTTTALGFAPAPKNKKFSANVIIDGLEVTGSFLANDKNLVTVGAEYRSETRESSAINPNPLSNVFITKKVDYSSLFVQDEIEISDTLNATIGARYDDIGNAKAKATAKAGIIKNLRNDINIRANIAQGYRAPDVAELYVVSPFFKDARRFGAEVIFGPKAARYDLKPETSQTVELAISKRGERFFGELVLFQNDIEDKISLVAKNSGTPAKYYTSENLKDVEIKGMEVSTKFKVNNKLDLGFNATLLDSENKATNKELAFTPKVSAAASLNYQLTPKLSSSLIVRHVGDQYIDQNNTIKATSYTTSDLSLAYKANKRVEVYGGINNLSDTKIVEALGSSVGRFFFVGVRSSF